jgi:signal peptidase
MLYTNAAIFKRINREIKIKKILNFIVYIILIPLLIYNISLIIQNFVNPTETPNFFGIKTYVIISGSMEPQINIGDIVVIKSVSDDELQTGDIISFKKGQSVITHRIASIDTNENGEKVIVTKGDNNNTEDSGTISFDDVEGKLIKIIPKFGKVVMFMQNKYFITIVLLLFYTYIVKSSTLQRKRKERRRKRIEFEESINNI